MGTASMSFTQNYQIHKMTVAFGNSNTFKMLRIMKHHKCCFMLGTFIIFNTGISVTGDAQPK
jgi:hypothetical protein